MTDGYIVPDVIAHDGSLQCGHCGVSTNPLIQYGTGVPDEGECGLICLRCVATFAREKDNLRGLVNVLRNMSEAAHRGLKEAKWTRTSDSSG